MRRTFLVPTAWLALLGLSLAGYRALFTGQCYFKPAGCVLVMTIAQKWLIWMLIVAVTVIFIKTSVTLATAAALALVARCVLSDTDFCGAVWLK